MLYFAYGSNLNKRQMLWRCPKAVPVGPLILPDARLVFRGVADVEYHEGGEVQGGLWSITKSCERALDTYEGVSSGLYRKEYITLEVKRGGKARVEKALVYIMNSDDYAAPSQSYFDVIEEGFGDFGLDVNALYDAVYMFDDERISA